MIILLLALQGIVIPDEPDLPPLALERHAVTVSIDQQASVTTVEQVFLNNTDRRLEAQYLFPIPKGAAITRFTMMMNGRETSGEIVEKDKAREIYNSIVNRSKDPGLLEHLGGDIFRANIFPIEPHDRQTITIRFNQVLPTEGGLVHFVYPVRAGAKRGPTVHGNLSIELSIKSAHPLHNIYSPSHAVVVERRTENDARVTFTDKQATLTRDFQLYYGVDDKDVGLNLVTYRPDPNEPGTFMMLISPRSKLQAERIVARDIVFVVDTSGSMSPEKMAQAKAALKYCVANLNDGDRFNIVRFATDVYPWKEELVDAAKFRDPAARWIDAFEARGGTDIGGALSTALSYPRDPARPYVVIFMTDGKPTVGDVNLKKTDPRGARIFSWGVGYDVDTQLLDALSGGVSEYVHPDEDIAAKVSAFWGKASHPVLTDLKFELLGKNVELLEMHPKAPQDLYAGSQLVLFGRYTGDGAVAMKLTGRVNDKVEEFVFEGSFAALQEANGFVEPLWARRRIGYLLDEIRLNGEHKELIDEVVRLSRDFGIQTPYTSFLILEDGTPVPAAGGAMSRKMEETLRGMAGEPAEQDRAARDEHNDAAKNLEQGFKGRDGKASVDAAGYLRRLKEAERDESKLVPMRKAGGTRFVVFRDLWVDERLTDAHAITTVKFGSAAYFRLIEKRPELVASLKLGMIVLVTAPGKALAIAESGDEKLGDDQIEALFMK